MQSKANKENMIATAMGQLGNFSQQQQLMYGQKQADNQKRGLIPALIPHYAYENLSYSLKEAKDKKTQSKNAQSKTDKH